MDQGSAQYISIGANSALVALRLIAASMTLSHALWATGIFSLLSLVASITTLYLGRRSELPPDELHTYGYSKYHSLSHVIEMILVVTFSGFIILQAVNGLADPFGIKNAGLAIFAMIVSIPLDLIAFRTLQTSGRRMNSGALELEARRFFNDLFISMIVLIALISLIYTGTEEIDDIAALIVAIFILTSSWLSFKDMDIGLLDGRLPPEEEMVVRNILIDHSPHFVGFHRLRTRQSGNQRFIDLHLQVDGRMTVEEAHRLADHIEKEIEMRLPNTNVIIHVEPDGE